MYGGKIDLAYIWKKDTIFKSADINLSEIFKFKYDYKKRILKINKRNNAINNFWGSENIGIKGIVGGNGAGKTSILKVIRDEQYIRSDCEEIRVFYIDKRFEIYCKKGMIKDVFYNDEKTIHKKQDSLTNITDSIDVENAIRNEYDANIFRNDNLEYKVFYIDNLFIINISYSEKMEDGRYKIFNLRPSDKITTISFNNSIDFFQDGSERKAYDIYRNIDVTTNFLIKMAKRQFRESINNSSSVYKKYTDVYLESEFQHFISNEQIKTVKFLSAKNELFNKINDLVNIT